MSAPVLNSVVLVSAEPALEAALIDALGASASVERVPGVRDPRGLRAIGTSLVALVIDARGGLEDRDAIVAFAAAARLVCPAVNVFLIHDGGELDAAIPGLKARGLRADEAPAEVARSLSPTRAWPGPSPVAPESDPAERAVVRTLASWGPRHGLTATEVAVVQQVTRGLANKEIGRALGTSVGTVRTHLGNACAKLGISSRGELAYLVFRECHASQEALLRNLCGRPVARVDVAPRRRVVAVSGHGCLRDQLLEALDGSERLSGLLVDAPGARALLGLADPIHGLVVDLDTEDGAPQLVRAAAGRAAPPVVVLVSRWPEGAARASALGAAFLGTPFVGAELVKLFS